MVKQRIKMIVHGDVSYAKERENSLDQIARLKVIPSKSGQVFRDNAIDLPIPRGFHHFLKCRPLEIRPRITIIDILFYDPELFSAVQISAQDTELRFDRILVVPFVLN